VAASSLTGQSKIMITNFAQVFESDTLRIPIHPCKYNLNSAHLYDINIDTIVKLIL